MKAAPLLVSWHNDSQPIYSAHFEPHGKGRLATGGGDGNVRLWKIDTSGDDRNPTYLSTLVKHTQAVNVVRWCPRGELLGSAGDDGNVLLWVPSENQAHHSAFGEDGPEDKETWRVKHMCRSFGSEIYDMAWSPDGVFFITGSMDNIARIYNAQTGQTVRQIAEHNHYVQGVAWDPLNEFVATQSSDRSVHIYTLKTKDGQFSLAQHNKVAKMDLPGRRISSNSPAPPDFTGRAHFVTDSGIPPGSPAPPSAPGTPNSLALPMNPPPTSHSRRSSFGSSPSIRRSVSPAPSLPLPAVMPSASPNMHAGLGVRNTNIYANETLTSFFRRLTFAPDGSLLFTPAGQYKTSNGSHADPTSSGSDIINTVYIYTRAGLNKPPIAYLPGHKKPSVAVKCSPIFYTLRQAPPQPTKEITIDTASAEEEISELPAPVVPTKLTTSSSMDPPPLSSAPSPAASAAAAPSPRPVDSDNNTPISGPPPGPPSAFGLPYRMIYAVATQDAIHVYDTQQQKPLCIVSNLHFATFTDLTWSNDGNSLLMTSSDGFCSTLTFQPGELGTQYHAPSPAASTSGAGAATPVQIPPPRPTSAQSSAVTSAVNPTAPTSIFFPASPSSFAPARPASPARSMSASSVTTQSSFVPGATPAAAASFVSHSSAPSNSSTAADGSVLNNPIPSVGAVPSVAAANSGPVPGAGGNIWTPPQTPSGGQQGMHSATSSMSGAVGSNQNNIPVGALTRRESDADSVMTSVAQSIEDSRGVKRDAEDTKEAEGGKKKRRVQPTLVEEG
ncbi:WD40 repeat-like protein [Rhizodiscina lignyota]|uniref:WD40 repeat-like protein n=1 Tax=Rhizodiscina lignyota TaxID=1504668 RepID=A0A9P4MAA6_9PEZI|nr:WD40 repeat-like protein [Rhizodiscina lignyota]